MAHATYIGVGGHAMRRLLQSIRTVIQKRPSFETMDDIELVTAKVKSNISKFSFKDIVGLEKLLLMRVTKGDLKAKIKKTFGKIKGLKGKVANGIKERREKKLKKQIEKKRRQAIIDSIPSIREYHEKQDDKESTDRMIKDYEETRERQKNKQRKGMKIYQPTLPETKTTWGDDPLTPPKLEE